MLKKFFILWKLKDVNFKAIKKGLLLLDIKNNEKLIINFCNINYFIIGHIFKFNNLFLFKKRKNFSFLIKWMLKKVHRI